MTARAARWSWLVGSLAALAATAAVTAGTWGRGVLLYRDDVQVPRPVLGDAALGVADGPPRAVPYAGVLALLGHVVGAAPAQRLLLLAPLLLAGCGVSVLMRRHGAAACVVAAVAAVWNPYVAERLGLGQAPTLLAYGALPCLVVAVRWSRGRGPLAALGACTLAALPAALTPVGSVLALVVLAVALVVWRGTAAAVSAALVGPVLLCAPWVVAALASGSVIGADDGAVAFAARDDTGAGVLLSVATLGGVWAPSATPGSRSDVATLVCGLLLLAVAAAGWLTATRRSVLGAAWLLPVAAVALAATRPGVRLLADVQSVPGLALLRDTHRLLVLAAVALAVGLGLAVAQARRATARAAAAGAGMLAVALVVLAVPDLPGAVGDDYRPTRLPADLQQAIGTVRASRDGVLSMPWQPLRRTAWNGGRTFLDPLDRAVEGPVLASRRLQVERDGRVLVTDGEAEPAAAAWARGEVDAAALAARGVGWVLEWRGTPGAEVVPSSGLTLVQDGPTARLWRVAGPVTVPVRPHRTALLAAWAVAGATLVGAVLALVVGARRRPVLKAGRGRADDRLRK
ncbi:membrane protein [Angustibacter peucedani]